MALSSRPRAVNLALSGGAGISAVELPVLAAAGVDLAAVGRALGLDPATVLLNRHYLSRGPGFVSAVTWGDLLAFFAARGFPVDPIAVQGRPCPRPLHPKGNVDGVSFKRKPTIEDESPSKRARADEWLVDFDVRNRRDSNHESLCIKRRFDDEGSGPSKRQNTASCDLGIREMGKQKVVCDHNYVIKRMLEVQDRERFKRRNTAMEFGAMEFDDGHVSSDISHCIKGKMELESSDTFKKQNTANVNFRMGYFEDIKATSSKSHSSKRKIELEDGDLLKKLKTNECNQVTIQSSGPSCNYNNRRLILILKSAPLAIANGESECVSFMVDWFGSVDLGAIGRALRLDPMTVRLNRHFLSRRADLISSVTWDSIQSFFSARGFPTGDSVKDAIVVHGKPLLRTGSQNPSDQIDGSGGLFKRKLVLEDRNPCKNMIIKNGDSRKMDARDAQASDEESLWNQNKSLEDNSALKKPKVAFASGLGALHKAYCVM